MKIGYLSFRIAGNDGVSLEAVRWRKILKKMGHKVVFVAGELDRRGILIPELHFTSPNVNEVHREVVDNHISYRKIEKRIYELAGRIEGVLREEFINNKFDALIVANVFSLPIHFPLAVALSRVIDDLKIPTIAKHHDFWWERKRYLRSSCFEFFQKFFPPVSPLIKHVTINSISALELKKRAGVDSMVIGDCFDFNNLKAYKNGFSQQWRKDFGISKSDIVFLQATRIVPRKKIELSIELVAKLNDPRVILVLAGRHGDESGDYEGELRKLVESKKIRAVFIGDRVEANRMIINGRRSYTLWDCFHNCDLMTYPSEVEGFGNQFIEAIYFRVPVFINRYKVYRTDLEKLGFKTIAINGKVTDNTVELVRQILADKQKIKKMTDVNFEIARKYFSHEAVEEKLKQLGF
ncbi:glycosyltransferase family 4 protein [Candidatus Shapirobacteria bacterium]|nr:glycosyltransferase family 4 protein [Candidatus Shapirobacteria bacterium]